MLLVSMIICLLICCVSSLKITMRRKTGDAGWGEPGVTIAQVILIILLVVSVAMDRAMFSM